MAIKRSRVWVNMAASMALLALAVLPSLGGSCPPPPPPPPTVTGAFVAPPWGTSRTLNRAATVVRFSLTPAPPAGTAVTFVNLRGPWVFTNPTTGPNGTTNAAGVATTSIRARPNLTGRGAISAVYRDGTRDVVVDVEFEVDGTN